MSPLVAAQLAARLLRFMNIYSITLRITPREFQIKYIYLIRKNTLKIDSLRPMEMVGYTVPVKERMGLYKNNILMRAPEFLFPPFGRTFQQHTQCIS